jgi:hypothetical protein
VTSAKRGPQRPTHPSCRGPPWTPLSRTRPRSWLWCPPSITTRTSHDARTNGAAAHQPGERPNRPDRRLPSRSTYTSGLFPSRGRIASGIDHTGVPSTAGAANALSPAPAREDNSETAAPPGNEPTRYPQRSLPAQLPWVLGGTMDRAPRPPLMPHTQTHGCERLRRTQPAVIRPRAGRSLIAAAGSFLFGVDSPAGPICP